VYKTKNVTVATTDYYHSNHRGDIVFTTDETGDQKAELRYDAFGKTVYELNAGDVKYRFSSKEWDSVAQLYYYGFRWYDPTHGIWTTKDPLGIQAGDLNVYRMVFNNPVGFVDSFGLWTLQIGFSGTGGAETSLPLNGENMGDPKASSVTGSIGFGGGTPGEGHAYITHTQIHKLRPLKKGAYCPYY